MSLSTIKHSDLEHWSIIMYDSKIKLYINEKWEWNNEMYVISVPLPLIIFVQMFLLN